MFYCEDNDIPFSHTVTLPQSSWHYSNISKCLKETFSQQVNIVYEFQKTCFSSCLLEIASRKNIFTYQYSPPFQSLQNVPFLVSVAFMQMSCYPLTNELSEEKGIVLPDCRQAPFNSAHINSAMSS